MYTKTPTFNIFFTTNLLSQSKRVLREFKEDTRRRAFQLTYYTFFTYLNTKY
ncbi:unnamed protein product [Meloidogyne enterolobii]|uniref:Uncharacterized protein n=1 Tax=Meloidogyne enterolobii TaxID=390850 RepID=A0ACB0YM96_MELEN